MRPDLAKVALQFLSRVQLNAQEIPAFQEVCMALDNASKQPSEVEVDEDGSPAVHTKSDTG